MMMHADGELQPAEEQELMAFVALHPELKAELKTYELTRLSPDTTVVYADKSSLLRSEPSKRIIAFPLWRRYAIAAGVALLLFVSFLKYNGGSRSKDEVAKTNTAPIALPSIVLPVADTATDVAPRVEPAPQTNAVAVVHHSKPLPGVPRKHRDRARETLLVREVKQEQEAPIVKDAVVPERTAMPVEDQPIAKQVHQANRPDTLIPVALVQPTDQSDDAKPRKKSLIDRLPIDEANKHQLKKLFRIAKGTYSGVSKAKQELEDGEITVRVEDKKLRISF